jgi:hypothetical protein
VTPEDQIRALRDENAQLRAALQGNPYAGMPSSPGPSPNRYGQTPDDLSRDEAMSRWQAEQAYMGGGAQDLMYRTPPAKKMPPPGRKVGPSPYMRKE